MNPFEFYQLFLAANTHFTSNNYDFFKYNGKIRCNESSFNVTKGKYHYEKFALKLSTRYKAICFITGNFLYRDVRFITDCSFEPYEKLMSYSDAISYKFEQDVIKYTMDVDPIKECFSGSKDPWLYLIVADHIYNGKIFQSYDKKYSNNIVWDNTKKNILKFKSFVVESFQINDLEKIQDLRKIVKQNT